MAIDDLLANNDDYAAGFTKEALSGRPTRRLAVLACMDARIDPAKLLGLEEGDAHVIRNAGGSATEDAVRSLVVSQRLLGTEEIVLIHHTGCGMESFGDAEVLSEIEGETGKRPAFALGAFGDAEEDLRSTARLLEESPFVSTEALRAFIYDVTTGRLREVDVS